MYVYIIYIESLALKSSLYRGALGLLGLNKVYTIWAHGPLGLVEFCEDAKQQLGRPRATDAGDCSQLDFRLTKLGCLVGLRV